MSDTPRTDAAVFDFDGLPQSVVPSKVARQLERELHEAGDGDTWREACKRVEAENRELREALERIRQWDMLDVADDGPFWKGEIDRALKDKGKA